MRRSLRKILCLSRAWRLVPPQRKYLGLILTFHRVIPQQAPPCLRYTRQFMVRQAFLDDYIRYFVSHDYEVLSPSLACERLQAGEGRGRFVVFTFDDGFRDNLELAYPVFKKHEAPFTIYVCTGVPEGRMVFWPYLLDHVIMHTDRIPPCAPLTTRALDIATPRAKAAAYDQLRPQLLNLPEPQRCKLLIELAADRGHDATAYCRGLSLTWKEVQHLSRDPLVTIGAHSVNHYELSALSGDEATAEVIGSKEALESWIERPVQHFAYPYGCKPREPVGGVEILRRAGLQTAVTTRPGYLCREHQEHLLRLPRFNVDESVSPASLDIQFKSLLDALQRRDYDMVVG